MTYAAKTEVSVAKTKTEIENLLKKYGATRFAFMVEERKASVAFEAKGRRIRFDIPLPALGQRGSDQAERTIWRALLLCIKAKLESVQSLIETFEDAFLAHVVMPDGKTVGEKVRPTIAISYSTGQVQALLPPPSSSGPRP